MNKFYEIFDEMAVETDEKVSIPTDMLLILGVLKIDQLPVKKIRKNQNVAYRKLGFI